MKKILSLLGAFTLTGTIVPSVVACIPPRNSGGSNIIGYKLDLNLFAFDKIGSKFKLRKDNVIVNDEISLEAIITKGVQNLSSVFLPWNEVYATLQLPTENMTFKQVYMKMVAKADAKSMKGSVMWGDLEAKPTTTYVDLRPTLKEWLSLSSQTLKVKNYYELDTAATAALGGAAFKQTDLAGLKLKGEYNAETKEYTVSVLPGESNLFQTSDISFKIDMQ
ncbi:lipoprotein [Spiroplasma endosymbiont of Polydrusus pterygomalis]|uniref:lipoprotein n=1 Tax=Spiroplasma endosymbiont of Polydrusus pterygomalis TaxID=3139327 RepID=UPI003CCADD36